MNSKIAPIATNATSKNTLFLFSFKMIPHPITK